MEDMRYDFAKEIYKIECDRENGLNNKSQIYLSLLTIILSSLIFNIKDIFDLLNSTKFEENKCLIKVCLIEISIFSCFALGFLFFSMKIFNYKNLKNINDIKPFYFPTIIDNHDFISKRSIDFLIAAKHNRIVNNTKADLLKSAFICIFISFIFSFLFLTLIITRI